MPEHPSCAGPWVETYSGHMFPIFDPKPEDVHIEDIAHALSQQCRFQGNTREFFSVAQHSLMVAHICRRTCALSALLHDAAEAYIGDIPKPLKPHVPAFKAAENGIMWAIDEKFGLGWPPPPEVKVADNRALVTEAGLFMQPVDDLPGGLRVSLPPVVAEQMFLDEFERLTG